MKEYNSELFGLMPQPSSFRELLDLLLQRDNFDGRQEELPVKYWRGQSNIDWRIDSSAFRRIKMFPSILASFEKELEHYEQRVLRHATHQGYRYINGRELADFELLALLQHHGTATRLLDFSSNALVALWFACRENLEKPGILLGVHSDSLGGLEKRPIHEDYAEVIRRSKELNHPILLDSPSNSVRIPAQNGQFLFSGPLSDHKAGSLVLDYDNPKEVTLICISNELKKGALEILEKVFDIRMVTLFPDLDGFGMSNGTHVDPSKMYRW